MIEAEKLAEGIKEGIKEVDADMKKLRDAQDASLERRLRALETAVGVLGVSLCGTLLLTLVLGRKVFRSQNGC